MSVKHVKNYYDNVVKDYIEMKHTLEEMENLISSNSDMNLSNINNIREMVNKMKENYMRISYIIYLLNMPNKKEKKKKYIKQYKDKINQLPEEHTLTGVLKENNESLENIKNILNN